MSNDAEKYPTVDQGGGKSLLGTHRRIGGKPLTPEEQRSSADYKDDPSRFYQPVEQKVEKNSDPDKSMEEYNNRKQPITAEDLTEITENQPQQQQQQQQQEEKEEETDILTRSREFEKLQWEEEVDKFRIARALEFVEFHLKDYYHYAKSPKSSVIIVFDGSKTKIDQQDYSTNQNSVSTGIGNYIFLGNYFEHMLKALQSAMQLLKEQGYFDHEVKK